MVADTSEDVSLLLPVLVPVLQLAHLEEVNVGLHPARVVGVVVHRLLGDTWLLDVVEHMVWQGLENLGNTCYFNSVVQVLLHCPLARQAIENAPHSIHVLRELRTLFTRMTNDDASTFISPSECFDAVMNSPQCI